MDFTFKSYFEHIALLKSKDYAIVSYGEKDIGKCAILRHDVDFDLKKAAEFAKLESEHTGVSSTYFVLLKSDFYNLFSVQSKQLLREIQLYGHKIGLHFDETNYAFGNDRDKLNRAVLWEKSLLEQLIECSVTAVSMHRPSQFTMEGNFQFDGCINSYSQEYFKKWKYLSDSRMHWREDLRLAIESGEHNRLHILTHPFWYADAKETARDKLWRFIECAKLERYDNMSANFRNLEEFVRREEVL